MTQKLKGYLRGVRGVLVTEIDQEGNNVEDGSSHWVDTAQQVEIEAEVVDGESADLRGGDRLLLRVEEDDIIVGADLTFRDARFDAEATTLIGGGELIIADAADAASSTNIDEGDYIGWVAPTIEEQATRTPFQADVYVQSFDDKGGREGYLVYSFAYCRGRMPQVSHSDRSWGTPEFEIKARENSGKAISTYQKRFVSADALASTPPDQIDLSTSGS